MGCMPGCRHFCTTADTIVFMNTIAVTLLFPLLLVNTVLFVAIIFRKHHYIRMGHIIVTLLLPLLFVNPVLFVAIILK